MQKQFNLALAELFNLPDSLGYGLEPHKQLLLGIAHYGAGNYGMSKMAFEHFIGNKPETISLLNVQFERVEKAGRINPKTARILSIIIPGAGQFYVGDIKNGINSLLLTGGLAVLSVYVAMTYSILDAFISIIPWYQRYYTGGIKKASIIARNKRDAKRANAYRQIIRIISDTKTTAGEDEQ